MHWNLWETQTDIVQSSLSQGSQIFIFYIYHPSSKIPLFQICWTKQVAVQLPEDASMHIFASLFCTVGALGGSSVYTVQCYSEKHYRLMWRWTFRKKIVLKNECGDIVSNFVESFSEMQYLERTYKEDVYTVHASDAFSAECTRPLQYTNAKIQSTSNANTNTQHVKRKYSSCQQFISAERVGPKRWLPDAIAVHGTSLIWC